MTKIEKIRVQRSGITTWEAREISPAPASMPVPLFRTLLGESLRSIRQRQGRTLRDVTGEALISLGYLSEVERGQKEIASEILQSVAEALGVPLSSILQDVAHRMSIIEQFNVPDTIPAAELQVNQ